jgi:hypothetical protein
LATCSAAVGEGRRGHLVGGIVHEVAGEVHRAAHRLAVGQRALLLRGVLRELQPVQRHGHPLQLLLGAPVAGEVAGEAVGPEGGAQGRREDRRGLAVGEREAQRGGLLGVGRAGGPGAGGAQLHRGDLRVGPDAQEQDLARRGAPVGDHGERAVFLRGELLVGDGRAHGAAEGRVERVEQGASREVLFREHHREEVNPSVGAEGAERELHSVASFVAARADAHEGGAMVPRPRVATRCGDRARNL